ncbi:MAG: nicotinate (nicotinamide) nucleotide adenylyltransferase [Mariprofundus sp.]|nr:nicotinate (nicotinamide) nucleotide adenylyltransferase [Mariprofundus sp.]
MNIGLFGGTFDPPHVGHVALGKAGLQAAGLDEVWVIPANPVHRQLSACADGETRLAWMQLLFADLAGLRVIDWEVRLGCACPMIETLRRFATEYPHHQAWLILGADAWRDLPLWREYPAHRALCNVLVFARVGMAEPQIHDGWQSVDSVEAANSSGCYLYLERALPDISATIVRGNAAAGLSLQGQVPEAIRQQVESRYQKVKQRP